MAIFIILIFGYQNPVTVNEFPNNSKKIDLIEVNTLKTNNLFYDKILSTMSPNNDLIIADIGNKKIYIYDQKNNLKMSFGKPGNGPGEFNLIMKIYATKDRIFIQSDFYKISIFDYKGKLIKDFSTNNYGFSSPIFTNNKIILKHSDQSEFISTEFDINGNFTKRNKNKNISNMRNNRNGMMMMQSPTFIPINDGYILASKGEYMFKIFDKDLKLVKSYKKPFNRLKLQDDDIKLDFSLDNGSKKEQAQILQMFKNQLMKSTGGFKDDISSVLGQIDTYYLISIASESSNEFVIHVIDKANNTFIKEIKIKKDVIVDLNLSNKHIIVSYKNDEIGPYVTMYKLNIN